MTHGPPRRQVWEAPCHTKGHVLFVVCRHDALNRSRGVSRRVGGKECVCGRAWNKQEPTDSKCKRPGSEGPGSFPG